MGGGNSKSVDMSNQFETYVANTMSENITSTCGVRSETIQSIPVEDNEFIGCMPLISGSLTINKTMDNNCTQNIDLKRTVDDSVNNTVNNLLDQKSGSNLLEFGNSEDLVSATRTINSFKNESFINSLSTCVSESIEKQEVKVKGNKFTCVPIYNRDGSFVESSIRVEINPLMNLTTTAISKCIQEAKANTSLSSNATTESTTFFKTEKKDVLQTGGEALAAIISSAGEAGSMLLLSAMSVPIIGGIAFVVIAIMIFYKMSAKTEPDPEKGPDNKDKIDSSPVSYKTFLLSLLVCFFFSIMPIAVVSISLNNKPVTPKKVGNVQNEYGLVLGAYDSADAELYAYLSLGFGSAGAIFLIAALGITFHKSKIMKSALGMMIISFVFGFVSSAMAIEHFRRYNPDYINALKSTNTEVST